MHGERDIILLILSVLCLTMTAHDRKSWMALRPVAGQAVHWVSEWVSVCPSNADLCLNEWTYRHNFYDLVLVGVSL